MGTGIAGAAAVATDLVLRTRQRMWIMNVVWPVTVLWSGPLGGWLYLRYGRSVRRKASRAEAFPALVAKATTHCGAGCTLGDIGAELLFLAAPIALFGRRLFAAWLYELVAAFVLGIAFQYFTIKPMRNVSAAEALRDAVRVDALSLLAWQIGMFGWMAIVTFALLGRELAPTTVVYWFMMQLGMFAGFFTSYPVNWWLLKKGIKEAM